MQSNKAITLPPDERRCIHIEGVTGSRCPTWAMAGAASCPEHEPLTTPQNEPTPKSSGERIEHMVDTMFLIQDLLAIAIKTQVQAQEVDILTLAELSKGYIANGLNITRTMQAKQALEAPQNDWSLILSEVVNELEQQEE